MHQQIGASLWNDFNIVKRKPLCILNLFGDYEGIDATQRFYLPVNVQHLQLKKAGAIASHNPPTHTTAASFGRDSELVHLKFPGKQYLYRL
jgi:hypothetical protein